MNNDKATKIKKQVSISGQEKEVNVRNYRLTVNLANMLKGLDYPADKDTIVNSVIGRNTDKIISELLGRIEDKVYNNASEVVHATGLVKEYQ
ncbi:MAG: DUF2795 domain-containing protein [Candidatus Nitrosocosmicus sp.]|nr:DUF2795 domain-containing protein [Candidatus Nitrosocosmicus sp.]